VLKFAVILGEFHERSGSAAYPLKSGIRSKRESER